MSRLLSALIVIALALLPAATAYATPPTQAGGEYVIVGATEPEIKQAGGNMIWTLTESFVLTGALDGFLVMEDRAVIHASGTINFQGDGVFTGTVDGRSGTLYIRAVDNPVPLGRMAIVGGTGDLANLRGHATFREIAASSGVYEIWLHFEP